MNLFKENKTRIMKKVAQISTLILMVLTMALSAQAQKFGYLNSQAILAEMPEVKAMQSNLETLQKQLQKQGKKMVDDYKQKEQALVQKKKSGQMSPIDEKTAIEDMQKKQNEIMEFEKKMQKQLAEKEQKLLEPILGKVNDAIQAVAKENSLVMVFEQGVLLYADEATDISNAVKAKL